MFNTTINKAVAALFTALATLLGFANLELPPVLLDPNVQAVLSAIIIAIVTYLVPNKAAAPTLPPPPASGQGPPNVAPMAVLAVMLTGAVLGGCSQTVSAVNTITSAQNPVTMRQVYIAETAYSAAVLAPAANYRRLGLCAEDQKPTLEKPCAERSVVIKLQQADREVQATLKDLKDYVQKYPGTLGAAGLYDAFKLSVGRAQSVLITYNVGRVSQ